MEGFQYMRRATSSETCILRWILNFWIVSMSLANVAIDAGINPEECGKKLPERRIAGGKRISKLRAPWIVFVQGIHAEGTEGNVVACGGSIITRNVVLTAAHCLDYPETPIDWVRIFYNTTNGAQGPRLYAEKKILHPLYTQRAGLGYDIALLKTAEDIPFDKFVKPICLPSGYIDVADRRVTAVGYGATDMSQTVKGALMYAKLNALKNSDCKYQLAHHPPFGRNYTNTICTMGYGKDICLGDSGGPLTMKNRYEKEVQVGVASSSYDCRGSEAPSTFSRVSAHIPWIIEVLAAPETWEKLNVLPLHIV